MPRVSVITTAYNAGSYLRECVESVARQSFSDWEHVIVDDGSDDNVEAVLAPVFHDRIRLVRPGRMGHEAAMNLAIREASGDLLAVLDADDLALPNRIGSQAELLDAHSGIAVVGSRVKVLCDGAGVELRSMDLGVETSQDARRALVRGRAATGHSSVMMRRTFVDGAGGYDEQLIRGSDVDLISKAVAQNAFVNVPHAVTWKRIHDRQYFRKNLAHTSWHQRLAARRRLYWRVVDRLDASGWNRTRIPWLLLRSMLSDLRRR